MKYNRCLICILVPLLISGALGYVSGSVADSLKWSRESASALAGLVGFLGAQAFNYVCLLLATRYSRALKRRREIKQRVEVGTAISQKAGGKIEVLGDKYGKPS